ncbi:MAG: allophanate hydrolase, partial [Firmicutes bacterium]|nr:allophanate hydrolase [Bacillota bacterium]
MSSTSMEAEALAISTLRGRYLRGETTPREIIREIMESVQATVDQHIWITPPAWGLVEPYLQRIESVEPSSLPLWGIPFAIKDNMDLAGIPTTAGCPVYAYRPEKSAPVVERLVAAGAIPIGKTNMDQFATGLVGVRSPYGETKNAHRPELISGGSSSGSAVAVAVGQASFALGTDTAGSGRVPAALCGLVGFKPALGAWPKSGVVPACASLDCVTVFTQSVEEALLVDRVVRGYSDSDPWSRPLAPPRPALPSRLLLPRTMPTFFGPFAKEYRVAWEKAVEACVQLGIPVDYVEIDALDEAGALLYEGPWVAERWAELGEFVDLHGGDVLLVTERILRSGADERHTAAALFQAHHRLQFLKMSVWAQMQDAVLVLPTVGGTWTREQVGRDPLRTNRELGRYTNHCNLLDLAAIAVPMGEAAHALPFGLSVFARADQEGLVAGVALKLEASISQTKMTPVAVCGLHMRGYP